MALAGTGKLCPGNVEQSLDAAQTRISTAQEQVKFKPQEKSKQVKRMLAAAVASLVAGVAAAGAASPSVDVVAVTAAAVGSSIVVVTAQVRLVPRSRGRCDRCNGGPFGRHGRRQVRLLPRSTWPLRRVV